MEEVKGYSGEEMKESGSEEGEMVVVTGERGRHGESRGERGKGAEYRAD